MRGLALILCAVAAAALVAHSLVFNFVTDDAFISFVYSRNLAEHGQLVFNLGERVEGYTNFLWTVFLALLLKFGWLPEHASRVWGTAFGVATLFVCAWISRGKKSWEAWDALPAFLLAGVPGFACWSSGGLETQMFTFFVTLGAAFYLHDEDLRARSAIAFGLAALTRPEGLLFFGITGLHHLIARRRIGAREFAWAGWFALLVVPHLLWRRWYYGWWLPNTYYIKSAGGAGTWSQGGYYLRRLVENFHLWAFLVPALISRLRLYVALMVAIFFTYIASVGGDFMGLYRFALPVVPLVAVAASLGVRQIAADWPRAAQAAMVVALLGAHAAHAARVTKYSNSYIGADRGIDTPGYLRWYTNDRAAIGKWFGRAAKPDDFAAVGGAGAQVYYSRIPSLDCFGLSDSYIAHKVAASNVRPGHQKYAPLEYQLSRRPTIITSNFYRIQNGPYSPPQYEAVDWQRRGYRYVSVQIPGLSSPWYAFLLRNDRGIGDIPPVGEEREP